MGCKDSGKGECPPKYVCDHDPPARVVALVNYSPLLTMYDRSSTVRQL
jgi:hypothetical protein